MAERVPDFDTRLIEVVDRAVRRSAHADPLLFAEMVRLRRRLIENRDGGRPPARARPE
jgi:hypothetical protein